MYSFEFVETMLGITFDNKEEEFLKQTIREVSFIKGDHPVWEGDVMDCFYFIITGLVRGYYLDLNGNEVTKCFSHEYQFFSSECFRTRYPSTFNIECIESCHCLQVPYYSVKAIDKLADKINYLYVREIERLEKRVRSMLLMNAEERYGDFCDEYVQLDGRIPLKCIASYIGIDPASLSRIRHKVTLN